ncbi:ABC transporter substrate-binding protein [Pseudonocardia sp.]|uniref:ABC transporter substrate-binding protein n=1 Tax=Pseudonocardia sp. TaxID=60912 RepID=UPI003D0FC173
MPRTSRRRWGVGSAVLLVAALLTACGSGEGAGDADDPVKIAMIVHNTGPYADTGRLKTIGAKIAIDEINAAGGIQALGGAKVELVVEDAGESVATAVQAANRALSEGVVAGEGTGISSTTLAVTEVAERRSIPWLTMSYEDKITERGFRFVFATSPKTSEFTDLWVKAVQELAADNGVAVDRVGIVNGVNVVATSAADQLRTTYAPANGWDIVMDQTVEEGTLRDATPVVEQIRSSRPQLLLVGSSIGDIQKIARKQVEQGMTPVPWVLSGAPYLSGAFVEALGADAVNGTFAVASAAPFKGQEELAQKVRDAGDPFPQQYHFATYSHMYLIKEAIERAGTRDPEAIRDALAATDVTGGPAGSPWPAGRVRFDDTGRAVDRVAVLVQWQDGRTVTVYPVDRAQGGPIWPTLGGATS